MKIALDSNVVAYAVGVRRVEADEAKIDRSRALIDRLQQTSTLVCAWQALGEVYNVMLRTSYTREQCRTAIDPWRHRTELLPSSDTAFIAAFDLATDHKLQFWDALILSVAAEAGCSLLLSEDMQPGFTYRGVTIANPFADPPDRALTRAMRG